MVWLVIGTSNPDPRILRVQKDEKQTQPQVQPRDGEDLTASFTRECRLSECDFSVNNR